MSVCRVCNVPIRWATTQAGERVPLDEHEEKDSGPGRYVIITDGIPPIVEAIGEGSPLRTYVDHRTICQQPRVT